MLGLGGLAQAALAAFPPNPPTAVPFFRSLSWHAPYAALGWRVRSPQGGAIRAGMKSYLRVPVDCVIKRMLLVGTPSGSLTLDLYRTTLAHFPPTPQNSICFDNRPTLSSAQAIQDCNLIDWVTALSQGDILALEVVSCAAITDFTIALLVDRA